MVEVLCPALASQALLQHSSVRTTRQVFCHHVCLVVTVTDSKPHGRERPSQEQETRSVG